MTSYVWLDWALLAACVVYLLFFVFWLLPRMSQAKIDERIKEYMKRVRDGDA